MNLNKEEQIIYRHFEDMLKVAELRDIPVFSDFTGLNGMEILFQLFEDKHIPSEIWERTYMAYGGYEHSERKIICFLPQDSYQIIKEEDFPLACVKIAPVNKKFCDELTHRDFLGTVMNIGLERDQIGDIIVRKDGEKKAEYTVGYIFCKKNKASLLTDITRIRHTTVKAELVDGSALSLLQQYKEIPGSVSSLRLDAVISVAIKTSRSKCLDYIRDGSVYLNGRCCTENAKNVQNKDIISVRGFGKYMVETSDTVTKKGRYHIVVKQYI